MPSVKSLQPSPQATSVKQEQHVRSRAAVIRSGAGGLGKMLGSFCRVTWSYTKQVERSEFRDAKVALWCLRQGPGTVGRD